jgi:hypothetical protein
MGRIPRREPTRLQGSATGSVTPGMFSTTWSPVGRSRSGSSDWGWGDLVPELSRYIEEMMLRLVSRALRNLQDGALLAVAETSPRKLHWREGLENRRQALRRVMNRRRHLPRIESIVAAGGYQVVVRDHL